MAMMICERCNRRDASYWLTVQDVVKAQCSPCARVGQQLAISFGFSHSLEPIVMEPH